MTTNEIIAKVCDYYGFNVQLIFTCERTRDVADARLIIYKILKNTGKRITDIANIMERTHATVISGIKQVDNVRELNSNYNKIINKFKIKSYVTSKKENI